MSSINTVNNVECSFTVSNQAVLQASIGSVASVSNAGIIVYGEVPAYIGAYEADALFHDQVFATKKKRMTDDFKVNAINYTEAPNDSGVTVTIGG